MLLLVLLELAVKACEWGVAPASQRIALVVRGIAFRDCGHGVACDAVGSEPTVACARSHVEQFVEPLERLGWSVDVLVASYECGREWLGAYGDRVRADLRPSAFARNETQLDSLARALDLVDQGTYAGILVTRTDLYFRADLSNVSSRFMFHADMSKGAKYVGPSFGSVTSTTDKLHWIPGPAIPCFLEAVRSGECFANYDDDDPKWISGERCYPSIEKRIGQDRIGFLRDDVCPPTDIGTFGDNGIGDGCYLVLPRSLGDLSPKERRRLLPSEELGPYATGRCHRGKWVASTKKKRRKDPPPPDLRRR